MMKKALLIASVMIFAASATFAADTATVTTDAAQAKPAVQAKECKCKKRPPVNPEFKKRQADFENRLKLTDEQKAQAKEIRQKGIEQMKPIMEKIKEKRMEAEAVKRSRMAVEMQQEKLAQIHKEIKALKIQAHELRMQNMKDFEAILTKKQQKELKKMKEEGRKNFEKRHKKGGHPEFGPRPGFGPHPGFGPEGPRPEAPAPVEPTPVKE